MQHIDDSDGWLTDISGRLSTLHIRAGTEARPEPVKLARRLVELTGDLDGFHHAAVSHVDSLGADGWAE